MFRRLIVKRSQWGPWDSFAPVSLMTVLVPRSRREILLIFGGSKWFILQWGWGVLQSSSVPQKGSEWGGCLRGIFRGGLPGRYPSLITEVSSYFGFCPSQLTPLTWRTLMAVPVLGEFHGFSVGVHEILYSYYFAHVVNKAGFYHLWSRDGALLVEEPSRRVRGNYSFGDGWNKDCFLLFYESHFTKMLKLVLWRFIS